MQRGRGVSAQSPVPSCLCPCPGHLRQAREAWKDKGPLFRGGTPHSDGDLRRFILAARYTDVLLGGRLHRTSWPNFPSCPPWRSVCTGQGLSASAQHQLAPPSPVFPEVGSMIVSPGFKVPARSASSIIRRLMRSFTLPPALKNSHLATESQTRIRDGRGVLSDPHRFLPPSTTQYTSRMRAGLGVCRSGHLYTH